MLAVGASWLTTVCRFLRARKWDLQAAETMFTEAETWRKENHVDQLYAEFTFPEKEAVSKLYPKFYHKVDKDGRPVYIEQLGNLNIKQLFEVYVLFLTLALRPSVSFSS